MIEEDKSAQSQPDSDALRATTSGSEPSALDELRRAQDALYIRLAQIGGCTDGNCMVVKPVGMHTNGGCRCLYHDRLKAQRVVDAYRRFSDFAQAALAREDSRQ